MINISKITDSDFPSVFQASDLSSRDAQANYILLLAIDLSAMVLGSALAIYNYSNVSSKFYIYCLSGLLLLLSFLLSIIILTKKFEDTWYQGRALAESCKTLTWRFITCSELFENTLTLQEASNRFVTRIGDLSNKFSSLNRNMDADLLSQPIITNLMLDVRNLTWQERKSYYIKNRIDDQKNWYSNKARFNKLWYNIWFGVIILSQAASLISIVLLMIWPDSNWNFVGLFTTLASSAISWLQLKQHQELKQAYTTATLELNSIVALSNAVLTEDEFSEFVLDSENAISREHTMWLAQKRKA